MARPLRIEFAGAWYHLMNRGVGRRVIYPNDHLRRAFLALLGDIHERYEVEIHAWCLMDNHYHVLARTRRGNLGRAMRHLDGVYTQRHNRVTRTDGALFRGRYKAILVDSDTYLAELSRYIHCNPVEAALVEEPEEWVWSSYRTYLGLSAAADWLYTQAVLTLFGPRCHRRRYRRFVARGVNEEIRTFYQHQPTMPMLGSVEFQEQLRQRVDDQEDREVSGTKYLRRRPEMGQIISATAAAFGVPIESLLETKQGRVNRPRAVAISLCRSPGGYSLNEIAQSFGFKSYSGVAMAAHRLNSDLKDVALRSMLNQLKESLFGVV